MKLFVIGNGFDIGHGIPCQYSYFKEYLNDNREDILEVMEKFYYTGEDSDLWWHFEASLERDINYDSLSEIIGKIPPILVLTISMKETGMMPKSILNKSVMNF